MYYWRRGRPELRLQKVPRAMEAFGITSPGTNVKIAVSGKRLNVTGEGCRFRLLRLSTRSQRKNNPQRAAASRQFAALGWLLLCVSLLNLAAAPVTRADPIPVIFDTDIGNDVDDALALAMLHALVSRGEARLLAVTITKDNKWAGPFVNLVNTFYGRPRIPIGVVKGGRAPEDSEMIKAPCERRRPDGERIYPHELLDGSAAPDASAVLRAALAGAEDQSVVIVQVGFSTNLARLLDT